MMKRWLMLLLVLPVLTGCKRDAEPPTEPVYYSVAQKEWGLACSAILTRRNWDDFYSVTGCVDSPEAAEDIRRNTLSRWWSVTSREELLDKLETLKNKGHRAGFIKMKRRQENWPAFMQEIYAGANEDDYSFRNRWKFVSERGGEVGDESLTGWDLMRLVSVARWGVCAGYLEEEEAWEWIMPAAQELQSTFDSWEAMGENYLIGRWFWSRYYARKEEGTCKRTTFWLVSNQESPWVQIPWEMDLTGSPEPVQEDAVPADTARYFEGLKLARNRKYDEAIACLEESIEVDRPLYKGLACRKLANIYEYGRTGIAEDDAKARRFNEMGAQYKNEHCLLSLGQMYYHGNGVKRDFSKALEYWEEGAKQGHSTAMSYVGLLYSSGKGVKKNTEVAQEYYERATEAGSCESENGMAWMLFKNDDLWDADQAVKLAYAGVQKERCIEHYHTLMNVLIKAERYEEALRAYWKWVGFHKLNKDNWDDLALPKRMKKVHRTIVEGARKQDA